MLRSVSHRFALVKRYFARPSLSLSVLAGLPLVYHTFGTLSTLSGLAFGFRLLAGLHCIALALPCQPFYVSLAFACECSALTLLR